ncbi:MAG: hypothetical protein JW901_07390 [Dehalococcoidia bacterium]|nr:hypothetical protein [Dehalococcoidia bacterium]
MAQFHPLNLDQLRLPWNELYLYSRGGLLFSSPDWAEAWWKYFNQGSTLYAGSVEEDGKAIGIAPLRIKDGILRFIGSDNLFDFQDFIIDKGCEELFFRALLNHLSEAGVVKRPAFLDA